MSDLGDRKPTWSNDRVLADCGGGRCAGASDRRAFLGGSMLAGSLFGRSMLAGSGLFPALVQVDDMVANFHHTVHVMGNHDGSDIEFLGNFLNQLIDNHRGLRVKSGVGFIAK